MNFRVLITQQAEQDLLDLYHYIGTHDSLERAEHVLMRLEEACASLSKLPLRGNVPPELESLGITHFREIHVRPWRIIYEAVGRDVFVHAVLDSRRDLESLLRQRLTRR